MKNRTIVALAAILAIFCTLPARAQSLSDLFGGGKGSTLGNLIEGVFSSSDVTVADMEGRWQSDGPAVCFKGEGFLKQAGGVAAAAALESKLQPYYEQYGLDNAVLEVDADGKFTLSVMRIKLKGTVEPSKEGKGVFEFLFTALGAIKLASVTAYVQKNYKAMDVMFDATKFKNLLSSVGKFTGIKTVKALASLLDSYDGLCVGFHMSQTKGPEAKETNTGSGLGGVLGNILGGSRSGESGTGTAKEEPKKEENSKPKTTRGGSAR